MKWLGGMMKHLALCSHTSPFSHDRHCSRPGHTNPPTTILLAAARPADIPTAATGTGESIRVPSQDSLGPSHESLGDA